MDEPDCMGFTRFGHPSRYGGAGMAVVVNVGWTWKIKRMCVGRRHAGEKWTDLLKGTYGEVIVDQEGYGVFPVGPRGVAVWTCWNALGRGLVDRLVL